MVDVKDCLDHDDGSAGRTIKCLDDVRPRMN